MSQATQSPGFQPAVSASTANTPKTKRKARSTVDSKRLLWSCLPFITSQPGRAPDLSRFDVPAEDYAAGNLPGMQAFGDCMSAVSDPGKLCHEAHRLQHGGNALDAARLAVILAACQKLGAVAADIRRSLPAASADSAFAGLACQRVDILAGIITCCLDPDAGPRALDSLSGTVALLPAMGNAEGVHHG